MAENVDEPHWLNVSRETLRRLEQLAGLVVQWSAKINLVSKASGQDLWKRHILDSAQVYSLKPDCSAHWLDIGSGGGFPGLVVAVLADENCPDLKVTLVESDQRKAVFLREAARQLGLSANIIRARIEDLQPLDADILSARALAPLPILCSYADIHLNKTGVALFQKGQNHVAEVLEARRNWTFTLTTHASRTDPAAVILEMKDLEHV